jgi:hypothetical protein
MADAKALRLLGLSLSAVTVLVVFVAAFTVTGSRAASTASPAIATLVD